MTIAEKIRIDARKKIEFYHIGCLWQKVMNQHLLQVLSKSLEKKSQKSSKK